MTTGEREPLPDDDYSPAALVQWLRKKYARHHEIEDDKAADLIESLQAAIAAQPYGIRCDACGQTMAAHDRLARCPQPVTWLRRWSPVGLEICGPTGEGAFPVYAPAQPERLNVTLTAKDGRTIDVFPRAAQPAQPVAWRYRYGIAGEWKYANTEEECNRLHSYSHEPLYAAAQPERAREPTECEHQWRTGGAFVDCVLCGVESPVWRPGPPEPLCDCDTKTPELRFHRANCAYRVYTERRAAAQPERARAVPREPTPEMVAAGYQAVGKTHYSPHHQNGWGEDATAIYQAMYDAAPVALPDGDTQQRALAEGVERMIVDDAGGKPGPNRAAKIAKWLRGKP